MVDKVIEYLNPQPGCIYIDATCGTGHYSRVILEKTSGKCKIVCIDKDPRAIMRAKEYLKEFSENIVFIRDGFENLLGIMRKLKINAPSGILFDLGFSCEQISDSSAGFGFRQDGPLDMRFNPESGISAMDVINKFSALELAEIFRKYGELNNSLRIARLICEERKRRKFETTRQLSDFIAAHYSSRKNIHPATKIFQAIRIYVNDELENLFKGLNSAAEILAEGGRIIVISYHSLEDRIVKKFMKETPNIRALLKKPIVPDEYEKRSNPSSRSAKMRVAEVIL
jgi:16S rRNA (cytosine1402-N4)-methyltransferase